MATRRAAAKKQRQPEHKATEEQVAAAIVASKGNLAETARRLKLHSVYRLRKRIAASERLTEALLEAREQLLAMAESAVQRGLEEGSERITLMVLANFGRHAGWQPETQRIEQVGDQDVIVVEDWTDAGDQDDQAED